MGSLFPAKNRPSRADLLDPAGALARLGGTYGSRFRLLPYRTVGVDRGLLLAVRVDRLLINKTDCGPRLVALSPTAVSDGGGYQALIGAWNRKDEVQ
jgi:stage II sporulation protein GA (sporulation sigma-E factor processing peptidase)